MTGKSADRQMRDTDEVACCAACPVLEPNLCRAMMRVAEVSPAALEPSDYAIPARRLICRERDVLQAVPFVCQGWAVSAVTLSDGRRQILSFLLPGDIVSTALVFDPASQYSVEAITEVRYRTFKRTGFKGALLTQPGLFDVFCTAMIEEKTRADQLAIDLGRRAADERISRLILNLLDRLARRGLARDHVLDFPLRQHHIADATGLTVVHVGKVLSDFRRAGLVDINDRSLTISDLAGLRRIADLR